MKNETKVQQVNILLDRLLKELGEVSVKGQLKQNEIRMIDSMCKNVLAFQKYADESQETKDESLQAQMRVIALRRREIISQDKKKELS